MVLREPLQAYHEKRDFSRTPEPRGEAVRQGGRGRYVIQKHAASHLHYDFRLELGGVLKSWAIPKGPSLDPGEKRLARHVEDHPIEYGDFEGIIPRGEYGGGTVLLWDRGHWVPDGDPEEGYRRGKLKFRLHGDKLRGGFALVRMRGGEGRSDGQSWLLIKERDSAAEPDRDIVAERPESVLTGRSMEEIAADPASAEWRSNRTEAGASKSGASKPKAPKSAASKSAASKSAASKSATSKLDAAAVSAIPGARRAPLPETVEAQLATLVTEPPSGDRWVHEMKLDGYRIVAFKDKDEVRLVSRRGQDWTARFPVVADAVRALPAKRALLDGEVVVLRPDGVPDFQALQNAMREGTAENLVYYVFDLLHLEGYNLCSSPLLERKKALAALLATQGARSTVRLSDHLENEGAEVFAKACALGVEGIVAKEKDAPYVGGRVGSWLKVKCSQRQELVVGGFTEPSGSRKGLGALLVGYHDAAGRLVYAGKVGTGFSAKVLRELRARLDRIEVDDPPFVRAPRMRGAHWVKPQVVVEVRFSGWTRDARLRQPAFMGTREDRDPATVVRETPRPPPDGGAPAPRKKTASIQNRERPRANPSRERPRASNKAASTEPATSAAHVKLTHPDKVLYPEQGITKRALAEYYQHVAPFMLPLVEKRPLTLVRCPGGQGKPCFFQKHEMKGLAEDVRRVAIQEEKGNEETYLYIDSVAGLVSLVQMGALEIHTWGSRVEKLERPDTLVLDLDPGPGVEWKTIVEAARTVRALLEELSLTSFVKTTGGKGLHVTVPVTPRRGWDEVKSFARAVATALAHIDPKRYVATMTKARRDGKVFVDYLRNSRGATFVAPYSTRARPGGHVAMPLAWEDLDDASVRPATFTVETAPGWIARRGDPWAELPAVRQAITAEAMRKVGV